MFIIQLNILFLTLFCSLKNVLGLPMSISYCENDQYKVINHSECPHGINFELKKPSCVCINGIYRVWLDNCAIYDGFVQGACSTLTQGNFQVVGLRLSGNYQQSLTSDTSAILGFRDTDYQSWLSYPIGSSTNSSTDTFYTLNAKAYFEIDAFGGKKYICIEKHKRGKGSEICRFNRNENLEHWKPTDSKLEFVVKEICLGMKFPLKEQSCYGILKEHDSECSLSCKNKTELTTEKDKETTTESYSSKEEMKSEEIPDLFSNCNSSSISDCKPKKPSYTFLNQKENNYLNRILNYYSKLRQVKFINSASIFETKPVRSFELLDIMKKIAMKTCPSEFVNPKFIQQAIDLFMVLHKGRDYRYKEDFNLKEFEWIKSILLKCLQATPEFKLYGEKGVGNGDDFCMANQKAVGFCDPENLDMGDGACQNVALNISEEHQSFQHHFVVEVPWNVIDLTQIVCFPQFEESYRMFHIWEQKSEKLFTREIRKLWFNSKLDWRIYKSILTPMAEIDLYNLEMCIEAAYRHRPILTRLLRPKASTKYFKKRKRRNSEDSKLSQNYEISCAKQEKDFIYPC